MRLLHFIPICMLLTWPYFACKNPATGISIHWKKPVTLPADSNGQVPGIAGPIAGIHKDKLLIGGGANFPSALPWEGGKKVYQQLLHLYQLTEKQGVEWVKSIQLQEPVAYAASCSTSSGVVYLGGENESGMSSAAWLIFTQADSINLLVLPELPFPITNGAACCIENEVYFAGGETLTGMNNRFLKLDLNALDKGWVSMPNLPVASSHAVFVSRIKNERKELLYLGGRAKNGADTSQLFQQCWLFDLHSGKWKQMEDLPLSLSAALGCTLQDQSVLLLGGDDGKTFSRVEATLSAISREKNEAKKTSLIEEKNNLLQQHPGFQRSIYRLDVHTDNWSLVDHLPMDAPVSSSLLQWKKCMIMPSGEIRAGIRSPYIQIGHPAFVN